MEEVSASVKGSQKCLVSILPKKYIRQLTRPFRSRGEILRVVLLPTSQLFYPFGIEAGGDSFRERVNPIYPRDFFTLWGMTCWRRRIKTVISFEKTALSTKSPKPQPLGCGCYHLPSPRYLIYVKRSSSLIKS